MHEIEDAPSVEEYARIVALAIIARQSGPAAEDADQLPLF
jgi:hypothetical protein